MPSELDFDFIIIGSGFGGSVSALRLTEKGYRVAVLEMGKRYRPQDFPETNWRLKKFLWAPQLGLHGTLRMSFLRHVWILSGVGVGGGSLVYANTLLAPPDRIWDDPHWAHLQNWKRVMPPFYALARRMLGVTCNHYMGTADRLLQQAANLQGCGHTFYPVEVGVYFGEKGKTVPDPYFGGEGPARTGCTFCGGCMVGCRYGAKNSLDQNYLYLAEKYGAQIFPEMRVVGVNPLAGQADGRAGYEVQAVPATQLFGRSKKRLTARGVVFSGGVLGTVKLLLSLKEKGRLPRLSPQLGKCVRTNSESILAVQMDDKALDLSEGLAIGSGIHIDENTHIEAVRYPKGSDFMCLMSTLLTKGNPGPGRILTWLGVVAKNPLKFLKSLNPFGFAKSSLILLVMQPVDSTMGLRLKRSWWPPFGKVLTTEGGKIPTFIPQANSFAEKLSQELGGTPRTSLGEIFLNVPSTAHILGGAKMGADPNDGIIDYRCRVFNYKNMYVCDGSMIGANLGVNPSLTITALTEHAMSHIKPASETDWQDEAVDTLIEAL